MLITLIAAVGMNNAIGLNGDIPWRVPGELAYFKSVTSGCPCIMGRKTFESLPGPLPDRLNIVMTNEGLTNTATDDHVVQAGTTFEALRIAFRWAQQHDAQRIIIMGGERIYKHFLPFAHELLVTWVPYDGDADTYFPVDFDGDQDWKLVEGFDFKGTDGICRYHRNPHCGRYSLKTHIAKNLTPILP